MEKFKTKYGHSWEGLQEPRNEMENVVIQYFGPLMQRADSLEKTMMLGRVKAGGEGDEQGQEKLPSARGQGRWPRGATLCLR